ncbi:MAG: hypothetical protein ACXWM7_06765 [Parachlamydiaceae bacterium]
MADLSNKTPAELQTIIAEAKAQLEAIQRSKHKEVIAKLNNHRLKPVGLNNGLKVRIRVA